MADSNLIAYLAIPGERTAQSERVRVWDPEWVAPPLWRSEFRNALWLQVRTGGLEIERAIELCSYAEDIMGSQAYLVDSPAVLRLAATSGCSAYDCEFVALAQSLGVKLVTADRQVLAAFPETAVSLNSF